MKFIKLNIVHPTDPVQDTELHLLAEDVKAVQVPTEVDQRQRDEIKSLVLTRMGTYAASQTPQEVLDAVEHATL